MKTIIKIFLICLITFMTNKTIAQTGSLHGIISDTTNSPIPFVNIIFSGSYN